MFQTELQICAEDEGNNHCDFAEEIGPYIVSLSMIVEMPTRVKTAKIIHMSRTMFCEKHL